MARPSKYDGQAWRKASKSFQMALFEAGKQVSNFAIIAMDTASGQFIRDIGYDPKGATGSIPYYTGNLLDSIGVRILQGNTLMRYRTMETEELLHATKPQHMNNQKDIWGRIEIMRRINRPSRRTGKGVVSQLIVGVPYAQEVDWTHDYFPELRDRFVNTMNETVQILNKQKWLVDV
jgi:hypothetical protein